MVTSCVFGQETYQERNRTNTDPIEYSILQPTTIYSITKAHSKKGEEAEEQIFSKIIPCGINYFNLRSFEGSEFLIYIMSAI